MGARGSDGSPPASLPGRDSIGQPAPANLVAFVGHRVSARAIPPKRGTIAFDAEYALTAEVLEVVYGTYMKKTISFSSYVHIGDPPFAKNEFGLVYVSRYRGRFIQQKYLFQPVYPTKDGHWAGCGDPYAHVPDIHRHGVKPEPIVFKPPVRFDTLGLSDSQVKQEYPSPIFRVEGRTAVCLMGSYPPELFRVMAEGYLKARGVFGPNPDPP